MLEIRIMKESAHYITDINYTWEPGLSFSEFIGKGVVCKQYTISTHTTQVKAFNSNNS